MTDIANLYDQHIDRLFAFGSRFTSDRETIKDCIHDVFVKLHTKRTTLDHVDNVESYLYTSLRNRINDVYRRNIHLCDNEISDKTMRLVAESEEYYTERMEHQQAMAASIEQFFDKLSPRQRQIISLYYLEELKYDDICRIMGINYQSVRNLMHHSISRLRKYATQMKAVV